MNSLNQCQIARRKQNVSACLINPSHTNNVEISFAKPAIAFQVQKGEPAKVYAGFCMQVCASVVQGNCSKSFQAGFQRILGVLGSL